MNDIYKYIKSYKNSFISGSTNAGVRDIVKYIVARDIFENKIINIVIDTNGNYKKLKNNRCVNYIRISKDISELNVSINSKVIIYDMSLIPNDKKGLVCKLLLSRICLIKNKNIRIIIDNINDFKIDSQINSILYRYLDCNDKIRFALVAFDVYGLSTYIFSMFDNFILFNIGPFIRKALNEHLDYYTLKKAMILAPYNFILFNKKENINIIKSIKENKLEFNNITA